MRTTLFIAAALSASSVAPALGQTAEPNLSMTSVSLAIPEVPRTVEPQITIPDPAAPEDGVETPTPDENVEQQVQPSGDLSSLVAQLRSSDPGSREIECLAVGVYFEAKSEPLAGQLAVADVIANRAKSGGRFPSTYCGVLFQRSQFSFIRGRSLPAVPRSSRMWQTAVAIAKIADQGLKDSAASNALFFHARRVSPGWHLKRVASIGNHIFYR